MDRPSVREVLGSYRRRSKRGRPSKHEPMVPYGTTLHKKYRLTEIIGAGGYGQIFKAFWNEKKIHVAVKVRLEFWSHASVRSRHLA